MSRLVVQKSTSYWQQLDDGSVLCMAGVGDVSVWEFSGYQPYYAVYDQFVGDVNCIHVIVVNLSEPRDVMLAQLLQWLHFISARIHGSQPVGKSNSFFI